MTPKVVITETRKSKGTAFGVLFQRFPTDIKPRAVFISANQPIGTPPIYLVIRGTLNAMQGDKPYGYPLDYSTSQSQAEEVAYTLASAFAKELAERRECEIKDTTQRAKESPLATQ